MKIDLEINTLRVDVVTKESAPMNSLDHLSDKVNSYPNLPNNKKKFVDVSDCQEKTQPLFVLDEEPKNKIR